MNSAELQPSELDDRDVVARLVRVHDAWQALLTQLPEARSSGKLNPKGDVQQEFDLAAHELVVRELRRAFASGEILSEECESPFRFGEPDHGWRFVIDPVDGSDNRLRHLPLATLSMALLGRTGRLAPAEVQYALVGAAEGSVPVVATKAGVAQAGDRVLSTSGVRTVSDALISCELNHFALQPELAELLAGARGVRSYGCASAALLLVAGGRLDAHIDVRGRLTAESYLAAARIVISAGGHVCSPDGSDIAGPESLVDRTSIIAAASRELACEIVAALGNAKPS